MVVRLGRGVAVGERGGVSVSVEGRLVGVFAGMGEGEAVGFPLVALQAFMIKLIRASLYKVFTIIRVLS